MRKIILAAAGLLSAAFCFAQPRCAYKVNGIVHIESPRTYVSTAKDPFYVSVEKVIFKDGSEGYILELDYEKAENVIFPKNVKMTAISKTGVRDDYSQFFSASDKNVFRSEDGKNRFYYNVAKYLLTPEQIEKLSSGVKGLEVRYGWNPDEFYAYSFEKDEFSAVVRNQLETVRAADVPSEELGDHIAQYSNNKNSLTVITRPEGADGDRLSVKVMMVYLYYKQTNIEDYELHLYLSDELSVALDEPVLFLLADGSSVRLEQQRESPALVTL
ncbi:MAG: hypothetical protein K5984_02390, partial [Bacteroidales bacterium]|nr:hypothetical protein [Bacteroidales bacterium]